MCLIDKKELDRIVATHESSKELALTANRIIARLVDEGFEVQLDNDPYEYPNLMFIKKEIL